MAVDYNRQYVGARYVPKIFEDGNGGMEWKANTYYESLTIVKFNNTSYISRQPVSANIGNPAENPTFWANSGNYNAYIEELKNKIDYNFTKMLRYEVPQNRVFLLVGDSYGEGWTPDGTILSWQHFLGIYLNTFNNVVYKLAEGGAGWVNLGNKGHTFATLANTISDDIKAKVTDILVVGGYNDNYHAGTLAQGIRTGIMSLLENFPLAKVSYAAVGNTWSNSDVRQRLVECWRVLRHDAYAPFVLFNYPYAVLHSKNDFSSDGFHPNERGQVHINEYLIKALSGKECVQRDVVDSIGACRINNDTMLFQLYTDSFTWPTEYSGNSQIKLCDMPSGIMFANYSPSFRVPVTWRAKKNGSGQLVYHTLNGFIFLQKDGVYFVSWDASGNTTYDSYTEISQVQLRSIQFPNTFETLHF